VTRPLVVDEELLDDQERLAAGDPGGMLVAIASSGAQVRKAIRVSHEAGLERLAEGVRPRAVVVAGMGGSGIAGDVLAALAGPGAPTPVVSHRGYGLPGWVGPVDLVVGVSCSGSTEETLSAVDEAARRGVPLLGVGGSGSRLAQRCEQSRAPFVVVPGGRQPRASVWALSVPLLVAADVLGVATVTEADLLAAADLLDELSQRCRPSSDAFVNPAKSLALSLAGTLPMIWGTTMAAGVAAYRFACQLAENAKSPALYGVLPEANHNQVVAFDGAGAQDDLRLVLLREPAEHPQVAARAAASSELARQRSIPVTELTAEGSGPVERLASLVGMIDFASVYLALLTGVDPTPVAVIEELKARIAQ
jgi:glucose/mannose-6-phosphate isomerase